jgi:hypothetical protein
MSVRPDVVDVRAVQRRAIHVITSVQMQSAKLHQKQCNAGKGNEGQGREFHRLDYTGRKQECEI